MSVAEKLANYEVSKSALAKTLFAKDADILGMPSSIHSFRELILDLAVRGQLSERSPEDVDSAELLETVVARRAGLIEKGMIRRAAPFKPMDKDTYPFTLPPTWTWVGLEFLVEKMGAGSTPLGGKKSYVKDGIAFLRSQNVWNNGLRLDDVARIPPVTHERMAGTQVQRGDVLLNITGASIGRCSLVPDDLGDANVSQHVAIVRLVDLQVRDFLHLCMISPFFQNTIMDVQVGVSREGLSMTKLKRFPFPLPPLAEQKRIVSKVDRLMGICDRLESERRETLSLTDRSRRSVLASLTSSRDASELASSWRRLSDHFEILHDRPETLADLRQTILALAVQGKLVKQDPDDEPADSIIEDSVSEKKRLEGSRAIKRTKPLPLISDDETPHVLATGWKWARFGEVFQFIDYRGKTPTKVSSGVRLITAKNIRMGKLNRSPEEYVTEETYESWMTRGFPQIGDLLFTTEAPMGNVCEVDLSERFALAQRAINLHPFSLSNSRFLMFAIMSRPVQDWIDRLATGMTAKGIKAANLRLVGIPVAPLAEQQRIVTKVERLLDQCDRVAKQLRDRETTTEQLLTATIHRILKSSESE